MKKQTFYSKNKIKIDALEKILHKKKLWWACSSDLWTETKKNVRENSKPSDIRYLLNSHLTINSLQSIF